MMVVMLMRMDNKPRTNKRSEWDATRRDGVFSVVSTTKGAAAL
jgi:hypothetical protein